MLSTDRNAFVAKICSGLVARLTTAAQFPVIFHRWRGKISFRNRHVRSQEEKWNVRDFLKLSPLHPHRIESDDNYSPGLCKMKMENRKNPANTLFVEAASIAVKWIQARIPHERHLTQRNNCAMAILIHNLIHTFISCSHSLWLPFSTQQICCSTKQNKKRMNTGHEMRRLKKKTRCRREQQEKKMREYFVIHER